jgi:hypothetical protein
MRYDAQVKGEPHAEEIVTQVGDHAYEPREAHSTRALVDRENPDRDPDHHRARDSCLPACDRVVRRAFLPWIALPRSEVVAMLRTPIYWCRRSSLAPQLSFSRSSDSPPSPVAACSSPERPCTRSLLGSPLWHLSLPSFRVWASRVATKRSRMEVGEGRFHSRGDWAGRIALFSLGLV